MNSDGACPLGKGEASQGMKQRVVSLLQESIRIKETCIRSQAERIQSRQSGRRGIGAHPAAYRGRGAGRCPGFARGTGGDVRESRHRHRAQLGLPGPAGAEHEKTAGRKDQERRQQRRAAACTGRILQRVVRDHPQYAGCGPRQGTGRTQDAVQRHRSGDV